MEQTATNLSEIAANYVRIFDANSKRWTDVRDVFVTKGQITNPVTVNILVADEVETFLAYPNATSKQVPALDGMLAYIAQQKLGVGSVNNRYVTVKRKNFFTIEGDTHTSLNYWLRCKSSSGPCSWTSSRRRSSRKQIITQKVVRPTIILGENVGPM